jgi:predicted nuclease with TOPRIM domain
MAKKKGIAGSLIPDTVTEMDDGGTYQPATVKIVEFYDPELKPDMDKDTILSIYDGPRYGSKTLKELRAWCVSLKIPTSGSKKKLIDRLNEENIRFKAELVTKKLEEKKALDNTISQKVQLLKKRKQRMERIREQRLKTLIETQQAFDNIEKELNDIKITLKSFDSLF